jgi:general secretion pathway protein M
MIDRLTPAQGRTLALALAALVVVLSYVLLIGPLVGQYRYYDEKLVALSHQLHQHQALAKDRTANRRLLDQLKRRDLAKQYYLASGKPALASAELQQRIKRLIDRNQAELISTQVVSGQRGDRSPEVTVKVRLRGHIGALQKVLYTLETSSPILFLDNVVIQASPSRRRAKSSGQAGRKRLTISFDVSGHRRELSG